MTNTATTTAPLAIGTEVVASFDTFGLLAGPIAGVIDGRNWFFDRVQSYSVRYQQDNGMWASTVCPVDAVKEA